MSVLDNVTENDFLSQLDSWLGHNPNEACSKGGHAAYGSAVYQVDNEIQEWLTIDSGPEFQVESGQSFFVEFTSSGNRISSCRIGTVLSITSFRRRLRKVFGSA